MPFKILDDCFVRRRERMKIAGCGEDFRKLDGGLRFLVALVIRF